MVLVTDEDLKDEFDIFGIELDDDNIVDKLKQLCVIYSLDADKIATEWLAFAKTRKDVPLTQENLEVFDRERLNKKNHKTPQTPLNKKNQERVYNINNVNQGVDSHEAEDLYSTYGGTPSSKGTTAQKRQLTPDNPTIKRFQNNIRSPAVPFSPASFSPIGTTPSKKYSSRTNAGDVVACLGSTNSISWQGQNHPCSINQYDPLESFSKEERDGIKELNKDFKYMFQKLTDKALVLNDIIEDMASQLQEHYKIEDLSHVAIPIQNYTGYEYGMLVKNQIWLSIDFPVAEDVAVVGRIGCDSLGKLNAKSVILEGSRETSAGRFIALDLAELKQYSLFPGQIVAMEGINTSGQKFVVNKLYEGIELPLPKTKEDTVSSQVSVMIAAGPFSISDNLSYEPMADLVKYIRKDRPDVVIMIGPFVDAKNELIENGKCNVAYEEIFEIRLKEISNEAASIGCQVVILPSYRDVHHDYVYPQPPFFHDINNSKLQIKDKYKNLHFMSDPCIVNINNTVFGITSSDIMFHLGAEEISFNPPGASDRMGRLAEHLLTQQNFYPLYPPLEDVNIDYEMFEMYARMPCTPHVLIVPSDLKQFIKDIRGCCCINPGRLARGQVGGTFARMVVNIDNMKGQQSLVPNISAQILRI